MNIEEYREFCLSLGDGVEEKLPFTAFRAAGGVLAFYVHGHIFSFFNCDDFSVVTLKCQPARIAQLQATYACVGSPFNMSSRHWIGIDPTMAPRDLLCDLTVNSYNIVKSKYPRTTS